MKNFLKKLLPESLLRSLRPAYHGAVARLAAAYYGHPGKKLMAIGVTGTKGKTTVVNLIAEILEQAGYPAGLASTATIKTGKDIILNPYKMSTVSEWLLEKWLAEMVKSGKKYAVLEMTSEGLGQNRHAGITFDMAVFTNLTPEHLESHGNFENYRDAKAKLFKNLAASPGGRTKIIVANLDDEHGQYFLNFTADKHISFGVKQADANLVATDIAYSPDGINFKIQNTEFKLHLKGQFDVYNALAAIAAGQGLEISLEQCKQALENVAVIPGRVEVIQNQPFTVVVDYAHEPTGMTQLYETVSRWPHGRIIHVLGPTGGGRDMGHKARLGELVAKNASLLIVTTDDPYDDDPSALAKLMADGAVNAGKIFNQNLFIELDRAKAMALAARLAKAGDLVLITGKGSEQKMVLGGGKMIDWDDRSVARRALAEL